MNLISFNKLSYIRDYVAKRNEGYRMKYIIKNSF